MHEVDDLDLEWAALFPVGVRALDVEHSGAGHAAEGDGRRTRQSEITPVDGRRVFGGGIRRAQRPVGIAGVDERGHRGRTEGGSLVRADAHWRDRADRHLVDDDRGDVGRPDRRVGVVGHRHRNRERGAFFLHIGVSPRRNLHLESATAGVGERRCIVERIHGLRGAVPVVNQHLVLGLGTGLVGVDGPARVAWIIEGANHRARRDGGRLVDWRQSPARVGANRHRRVSDAISAVERRAGPGRACGRVQDPVIHNRDREERSRCGFLVDVRPRREGLNCIVVSARTDDRCRRNRGRSHHAVGRTVAPNNGRREMREVGNSGGIDERQQRFAGPNRLRFDADGRSGSRFRLKDDGVRLQPTEQYPVFE